MLHCSVNYSFIPGTTIWHLRRVERDRSRSAYCVRPREARPNRTGNEHDTHKKHTSWMCAQTRKSYSIIVQERCQLALYLRE